MALDGLVFFAFLNENGRHFDVVLEHDLIVDLV